MPNYYISDIIPLYEKDALHYSSECVSCVFELYDRFGYPSNVVKMVDIHNNLLKKKMHRLIALFPSVNQNGIQSSDQKVSNEHC